MANRSKAKGTAAETAVVNVARGCGIPAKRAALAGAADEGDVWLWPQGIGAWGVVEVKDVPSAFTHFPAGDLLQGWWRQTTTEAARVPGCRIAILAAKPKGVSTDRATDWWAWALPGDVAAWSGDRWEHPPTVPMMMPLGSLFAWMLLRRSV